MITMFKNINSETNQTEYTHLSLIQHYSLVIVPFLFWGVEMVMGGCLQIEAWKHTSSDLTALTCIVPQGSSLKSLVLQVRHKESKQVDNG